MPESKIIIKPAVKEKFHQFLQTGRVLFCSAPCGFGKTSVAKTLLRGRNVCRLDTGNPDFEAVRADGAWQILLADDLQQMQDEADIEQLCALIRENADRRFVLLSRGVPPGKFMAFQYAGLMTVITSEMLLLDRESVRALFAAQEVPITDSEISIILKESSGHPLSVAITARCMAEGDTISPALVSKAYREIFLYFEASVYRRFDLPMRRFLLELAPFEEFNLQMARMVSGDSRAREMLDWLHQNTTMMHCIGPDRFRFWAQFRGFLLWEMGREYTPEKRSALFARGGMYYELEGDFTHALECYTQSGDQSKISELLIRAAELHPGIQHFSQMEKYYRVLPESELLGSPALMQGISLLCALAGDYKASERWYTELKQFADRCDKQDAAGRQARSRLAWLDVVLPQRSAESLLETIPALWQMVTNRTITLPPFPVTGTLPSIMNGGKDFSEWSKKDDLLYKTMRTPLETVLGKDGVALADCAIAESKFEKGEDISRRMLSLIPRMSEIQRSGTPDIEFALTGLLVRSQKAGGQAGEALRTMQTLRTRFEADGLTRFLPNIDAMICRLQLNMGDLDAAEAWYRSKAPRDLLHFNGMNRYQYFTQAMAELTFGKPQAAMMTLAPLVPYCEACGRHIDSIHENVLYAIALYRQKDEQWRGHMTAALQTAEKYQFVRTIGGYGAAVLPLMEELGAVGSLSWRQHVMADVRGQAACYPNFLRPPLSGDRVLTAAEMQILRLLCADKSNAEIGEILNIKLSTVKTHVSHILDKLDVKRRSEAKTAAKKLYLVPEDT